MSMFDDLKIRQASLHDRLRHIMDGKDPDRPVEELNASTNALENASDEELEYLITDPMLAKSENTAICEQVIRLLSQRKGGSYVDDLMEQAEMDHLPWVERISGGSGIIEGETPADRARDAFKEYHNPLAEIIPDELESFMIDPQGNFYMSIVNPELIHLRDFDLMMDHEISGTLETDRVRDIAGLTAVSQMDQEVVEFRLLDFFIQGHDITITTDHPLARVVHLIYDDFLVVL